MDAPIKPTGRSRVGVLPIGYADGFFRTFSNRFQVLTADGPALVLGRICMDMCMIDLTGCPNVGVGDEIEIFGVRNSVNAMARMAETIPYEIICAVSKRVPQAVLPRRSGGGPQALDHRMTPFALAIHMLT